MFSNLKIQVLASLLLASSLASGAVIQDLLPEPVADGNVKVYTSENGNAHGRVIISESKTSSFSATSGSISDNACFIETKEFPRTYFKRPEADQCFNIAAYHKLKIWKVPKCEDGSEAMLARYDAPGCADQQPAMLDEITDDMIKTCLDMPTKEPASYAFWCTGEIKDVSASEAATSSGESGNDNGNGSGSKKGGLGTFVLVLALFGLFGLMLLVLTIYRLLKMSQWFLSFFNKDGNIVLN